jgi:hypothetical protein
MKTKSKNSLPVDTRLNAIMSLIAAVEDGASPDASLSWNDAEGKLIKVHVAKYSK